MTQCFEVSMKREIFRNNTKVLFNNENQRKFDCPDHKLFAKIKIGDFIGVDRFGNITKVISKDRFLMAELSTTGVKSTL